MSNSGKREPPRPGTEVAVSATPEEGAGIAAAIEQFLADTAPPPQPVEVRSPWQRAALIEGVGGKRLALPPDPGSGFPVG